MAWDRFYMAAKGIQALEFYASQEEGEREDEYKQALPMYMMCQADMIVSDQDRVRVK